MKHLLKLKTEQIDTNNWQYKIAVEVKKVLSKFTDCEILHRTSEDDGKTYYEGGECVIKYKGIYIKVWKREYEKKYMFYNRVQDLPYIVNSDIDKAGFKEPNQVGVFSKKKINYWCEYWFNVYSYCAAVSAKRVQEVKKFNDLIDSGIEGARIQSNLLNTHGWIYYKDLEIHYEVGSDGYISQRARYTGPHRIEEILNAEKKQPLAL